MAGEYDPPTPEEIAAASGGDDYGPPTASEIAAASDDYAPPTESEIRAATGGGGTSVFGIKKDPENPQQKAKAQAARIRDYSSINQNFAQIDSAMMADALNRKSGNKSDLTNRSVQQLKDYVAQRKQQQTGVPEGAPMKATSRAADGTEHPEMPGAIRGFLESGGRFLGGLATGAAEKLNAPAPKFSDNPITRLAQAHTMSNDIGRKAASAVFDTSKPTITAAGPQIVNQYGKENQQESEVGATVKNVARSAGAALSKGAEAIWKYGVLPAVAPGVSGPAVALRQTPVPLLDQTPEDLPTGKTIRGPLGMNVGPREAAEAGTGAWLVADPMPKALGGAGKLAGKGASAVASIPAVQRAGKAVEKASRPVIDPLGKTFIGTPYQAKMAVREAAEQGLSVAPNQAEELARSITNVPYKQNMELAEVAQVMEKGKAVSPGHQEFVWNAIESKDPAARSFFYNMLSPKEMDFVDSYTALADKHGSVAQATRGQQLREFYAAHPMTKEAKEFASQTPRSMPPSVPGNVVPRVGGFSKERTLPEALSAEAGKPIETLPEVNDYVRQQVALAQKGQATSPIVAAHGPGDQSLMSKYGLKPGENLQEMNPAKNTAMRFVPSAQENVWAQTIKDQIGPLSVPIGPNGEVAKGFAVPAPGSLASKVLPGRAIPESANAWLVKASEAPKTGAAAIPGKVGSAWKGAVTALSGPGYHVRNELYSVAKNAEEFGTRLPALESSALKIESGAQGAVNGVPFDAIRQAASEAGTFAGTGAAPGKAINKIKVSAGLKKDPIPTLRKIPEAAGRAATWTDEHNRLVAIVGRLEKNGGNLTEAIDWAKQHIVFTGEASPALEAASNLMPFIKWTGKEAPNAVKFMASGKGTLPVKIQGLAEQLNGQPVADKFQDRRMREQSGFPTGKTNDIGQPFYMPQPWSVGVPVAQTMDPLYRAIAGESAGNVIKSGLSTVATNMWPPVAWGIAGLTGERPNTKTPLDRLTKASGFAETLGRTDPEFAKQIGMQFDPEGNPLTPGWLAMGFAAIPYAQWARALNSPTKLEAVRSLLMAHGIPLSALDPTYKQQEDVSKLGEEIKTSLSNNKKVQGIPFMPRSK